MKNLEKLPRHALTVVCDARKAILFRNTGTPFAPELETETVLEAAENPPNREQQSDRAGRKIDRTSAGGGLGPRSAMEQADQNAIQASLFAAEVVERLKKRHRENPIEALVIAAPPPFLGELRRRLPDTLRAAVVGELPKALTNLTPSEIATRLLT